MKRKWEEEKRKVSKEIKIRSKERKRVKYLCLKEWRKNSERKYGGGNTTGSFSEGR